MKMYDAQNEQTWVSREIDRAEITSSKSKPNHYGVHYSDTEKLEFLIIRNDDIFDSNDCELNRIEINRLRTWLESPKFPKSLEVFEEDECRIIYYGVFTSIQPFLVANRCCGLYLTFTCDSPYGYSPKIVKTYNLDNLNTLHTGSFHIHSAETNEYIKPIIKISAHTTFSTNHILTLTNITDNNKHMSIKLPKDKTYIIIDCEKKIITDNLGNGIPLNESMVLSEYVNEYSYLSVFHSPIYWLRLLPHENSLSFIADNGGVSKVEIIAQEIIKAGGF